MTQWAYTIHALALDIDYGNAIAASLPDAAPGDAQAFTYAFAVRKVDNHAITGRCVEVYSRAAAATAAEQFAQANSPTTVLVGAEIPVIDYQQTKLVVRIGGRENDGTMSDWLSSLGFEFIPES